MSSIVAIQNAICRLHLPVKWCLVGYLLEELTEGDRGGVIWNCRGVADADAGRHTLVSHFSSYLSVGCGAGGLRYVSFAC